MCTLPSPCGTDIFYVTFDPRLLLHRNIAEYCRMYYGIERGEKTAGQGICAGSMGAFLDVVTGEPLSLSVTCISRPCSLRGGHP